MIIISNTLEEGYDYYTTDRWENKYHFRILTFEVPSGLESEAVQMLDKQTGREPYIFQVLGGFDADIDELELSLKAKIQKGINKRYLTLLDGQYVLSSEEKLFGRIEFNSDLSNTGFESVFVVDGKRITIEQFVHMLGGTEGFNFSFQLHDPSDELSE